MASPVRVAVALLLVVVPTRVTAAQGARAFFGAERPIDFPVHHSLAADWTPTGVKAALDAADYERRELVPVLYAIFVLDLKIVKWERLEGH